MKKVLSLLLALAMIFSLAACGGGSAPAQTTEAADAPAAPAAEPAAEPAGDAGGASGEASGGASGGWEYLPAVAPDENVALAEGTSATFYYPKFYNYFDAAAKNQLGYMLWNDYLFMMDWSLNDPSQFDFTGAQITKDHIIGQAAESYVAAPDFSSIEITLRDGIKFQKKDNPEYDIFGGRDFTVQDAVYSIERLLGLNGVEKVNCETDWTTQLYMVSGVEVTGDNTFRVDFNTKSENALNDFIVECTTGVALTGPEWDALTEQQKSDWHYANGIGAYILTNYVADNYMQFIANPDYYGVDERTGEPLPHIANIKLVYIADSDQILTQFIAGELDWFGGQKSGLLNDSQIAQLKASMADGSYTEYFYPSGSPSGIGLKTNLAPWSDIRVRQALQHAINCEEIWSRYFGETTPLQIAGLWSTDTGDWAAKSVNMSPELAAEYTYDPALAQQLLADCGFDSNNPLTFDVVCDPLTDMDLYVLVQSYLAAVGVTMNIVPVPEVMEHNAIVKDDTDARAFNAFAGNFSGVNDVYGMTVTGGFGSGYFHNDEIGQQYDALYQDLVNAEDMATATEIAQQMDEIWLGQHWCITFGGAPQCSEFMSGRIGGFTGENIYNNNSMHTIFARLWVVE